MKVDVIKTIRCSLSICFIAFSSFMFAGNVLANVVNCSTDPNTISGIVAYDLSANNSYCELCGTGQVRLIVTNPSHVDMANFAVTHDFLSSNLEYVPGSTVGGGDPVINGSQLTWTDAQIPALAQIDGINQHTNYNNVEIVFQLRSIAGTEESLISANRNIQATAAYDYCPAITDVPSTSNTGLIQLPLHEPQPNVVKLGRNTDANQAAGAYGNIVYGNINDDVIWRIQINNTGDADLQDLKFDDLMQNGNFQTNFACSTEAEASSIAAADGAGPVGNCVAAGNSITDFFVDDPFGTPGNDEPANFVDVPEGGSTFIYLVGKITSSCNTNTTNTVSNVEWGCEVNPADGGISQTSGGATVANSSTTLSTLVQNNGLVIQRALSGINPAQPVGTRGLMTITLTNTTGGSVKNIKLRDVLPPEYVVDSTFTPTIAVTPQFGAYNGMVDTINWINPAAGTFPLVSVNPADPLANTAPEFDLVSSTVHPDHADQINMLRQGDVVVISFRVVMIPAAYFDNNANIDVRVENTADTTDPANSTTLANQLFVTFEDFCSPGVLQNPAAYPYADNFPSDPEDLDIDITGTELIFILTNDVTQPLPLQISLTNNGGHYADDFTAYVTFGTTMEVVTSPGGCTVTTNPPALEVWDDPADLPASATVYQCTSAGIGTVAPGQTRNLNFEVVKTTDLARLAADDLSLRADVVGEITLSDGSLLWFPAPDTATILNRANNYSLDSVRARVIGFNLSKNILGNCSENNPPALLPDSLVQIGEECTVQIDTGGWFGFQTPGFTYIAVQRIQVLDQLPDGQAYVSSTDPLLTSSAAITGINLNPLALNPLDEGWFDWTFNQLVPAERITVRDQWFVVNTTTRILNKPIDSVALPNRHASLSRNVLNSTFEAVFNNAATGLDEIFTLGQGTIGYPTEAVRRVDLTVAEPNILLSKQACNESLYGAGTACSNFTTLVDDGDTQDAYVYRITLTNQASASAVARAPAYNISSSDILDSSDLMLVEAFATDGLDNDADGLIDAADLDGEGSISDNIIANATPATITFSHTHSTGLLKLDAGASLSFYYRVNPDDAISPLQQLTNSVTVNYDSLEGASGNQTVVPSANSELAGARVYNSAPATATIQILPLQAQPKEIIGLSNTTLSGSQPQPVSVGEEVEYRLRTLIPVAHLKDFYIRDELPAGISCIEAPVIDLSAAPYSDAGFFPGGSVTPTCNDNLVYWYFGDQELTTASSNNLFDFPVTFIARVNNSASVNNAGIISNGAPSTNTFVSYLNETDVQIVNNFTQFDLIVREPVISLTKTFESAINDAADIITVTVTATNTGTVTAYNLRVLDDLAAVSNLTFLNNVAGSDPPDTTDTATLGANRPIFSWLASNPDFAIAAGDSVSFSFDIQVDDSAKPHEILNNTVQASWTSLPSQSTALNLTGSIGANGSGTGMRIGSLPNASDAVNDYESSASTFSTVPALSISKNDLSPALATEIGAHKNFEIVINLPEGISNNLMVNDELDSSGLSYVLSNNAGFDITYSFSGIATINGAAPSEAALTAFPPDASSGTAVWNIGTVVTTTEDDTSGAPTINPSIRINYFARINNDLNTDVGSGLQNNVTVTYSNGEDASVESLSDDTPLNTVTEPVLIVAKTATAVSAAPITAGDIIEYAITVTNTGDATAYDLNIVDSLPAEVLQYAAFTPSATIDAVAVAGFVSTPANNPAGPLIWGRNNGDESFDIAAGSQLVLSYQVQIQSTAQANNSLTNSVQVDWTSLNGTTSYERTGSTCPVVIAPDDYCAAPATAVFTIDDSSTLTKSVISDTFAPANDATVRVGDSVTYQLDLNLQQGTTRTVSVQDVLPAGMAFVDIVSINGDTSADYTSPALGVGSNFSYAAITAAALPVAGQTGSLSFTVGDVVNDPFGDPGTDSLSIIYRARVLEDTLAHTASTDLVNTATLAYIDGAGSPVVAPARLESSATITVLQPVMTVPTKIDRSGRPNNSNVTVATDLMNYRLSSCNSSGLAPAYSLHITDLLASQYDEASISGPVNGAAQPDVYINGALTTAGVDYIYTPPAVRGGSLLFELIAAVNPGQCVEIDYDIGFYNDFGANQNWDNTVDVDEYWSLALQSGQLYAPLGPTSFTVMNNNPYVPPVKTMLSPVSGEATIGETVVYSITLPASNAARFDTVITDTLDPALEYLSFTEVSGNGFVLTDNTVAPGDVNLSIAFIPAGQELVVELLTRVANNASANAGSSFNNTTTYTHADSAGGATILAGSDSTPTPLLIIEPLLSINKTVANNTNPGNPPTAGDILRYSLSITASGAGAGDNYSTVFDVELLDQLSSGLLYQAGSSTVTGGSNSIADPVQVGDGIAIAQQLDWNLAAGNANIDILESDSITVTYDVLVLDTVLANQALTNSVVAKWSGLDGANAFERTGSASPAVNDYFSATVTTSISSADNNSITKTRLNDTYNGTDNTVRIGDLLQYELRMSLQEGLSNTVSITDSLPQGLIFESVSSINADSSAPNSSSPPFIHNDISITTAGDPELGISTLTFDFGNVTNVADANNANDEIVIIYTARVLDNVHAQANNTTLTNNVQLDYLTASGAANKVSSTDISLLQPVLNVTKSAVAAGGDTVLEANELVLYTVDITNSGTTPAYDLLLEDIIPAGMRNGTATVTTVSTTLVNSTTSLANITPVYDAVTGLAVWDFDSGEANSHSIPVGEILRLVYQVQTDANIGAALTLTNQATARLYYSFDDDAVPVLGGATGVREIYGPSNTASTSLTTPAPGALLKENPATLTVAVGEVFNYQITIPATPVTTTLHDVRILDDLSASAADLVFVSATKVSGSVDWTPVNTGTGSNLIIEDTSSGIDIPAGEQVVLNISVQVANTATNISGLLFNNTATYTYNQLENDNSTQQSGTGSTTPDMTIVGPDSLTLVKSGPVEMRIGIPAVFTLDVQNTATATAWDITITDLLPDFEPLAGGMCNVSPNNITAQTFLADGSTAVSAVLVQGSDYVVNFAAAPSCRFSITMQSAAAALAANNRLIVTYEASLDIDTPPASTLLNVAGVTEWFSQNTDGAGASSETRSYNRLLTDGSTLILDHEDAHTVVIDTPIILVQKRVLNVTTGQDPGSNAQPGDTLRYSIFIQNLSDLVINDFSFIDDLDALNANAVFAAGSLNLISSPAGSNITNINASGGSKGTGIVDIRSLVLNPAGDPNDTVNIEFEVTLAPVITNATVVLNQGFARSIEINLATDDPNINGADDPTVSGDENATETLISSAAQFEVFKTSEDMTDDPAILVSGDTLRYTITVKNIGDEDAVNAVLTDQLPANTSYIANTTTLNGNPVNDIVLDELPLLAGIPINAAQNTTPGYMRGDATATLDNVATITFDVLIDADLLNGTIISNQAYINAQGAGSPALPEKPSDDPATPTIDDATRNVIGNQPLIDVLKTVSIEVDNSTPGILDPGDILRYTITISNNGATAASEVSLTDLVPADTTYITDSVTLNGLPLGLSDGGLSPLIASIAVSSSDLTPPLPTAANGVISAGESAVISFDVQVNGGVPVGTVISNQGSVDSLELPTELTDADGIDLNGDQPTLIAVGNAQLLSISKSVSVVGGGSALAGGQLEYRIRVTNVGLVPAMTVLINDDLDLPVAGQMTYLTGSGLLDGLPTGVSYSAPVLTADYGTNYGALEPGQSTELRFVAQLDNSLVLGTNITNIAQVYWNGALQSDSASASIDIGGTPGTGNINGSLWHDANLNNVLDNGEQALSGWSIDVYRNNALLGTQSSDIDGLYRINGLIPNDVGSDLYELRFRAPGSGATTASVGLADSPLAYGFSNEQQAIRNIVLSSGSNMTNLNLPIDPNGVVYDSILRTPIAGASISLLNAATGLELSTACFDHSAQQNQLTISNGYYKFDLNFSQPDCPAGSDYLIQITPPATDYNNNPSLVITAQTDASTSPLNVPSCPGSGSDAIPATATLCEAQPSEFAPSVAIAAGSVATNYYLHITLNNTQIPEDSQLFNNHLPIDPVLSNAVTITKTTPLRNVTRSQLVPYTITVSNTLPVALSASNIIDNYPAGFKYVAGSARMNGVALEPVRNGLQLVWNNIDLAVNDTQTLQMLLIVGAAVNEGEYINRAEVFDTSTNGSASGVAQATVRVIPDPAFDCSDVIGKVYDDKNLNGYQDENEAGLAGVRIITAKGLKTTSDQYGRFHVTCAVTANEARGSMFLMKVDERSLPTGYRVTTENPRVQRATRGKMLTFNFGATVHHVVSMDLGNDVFVTDSDQVHTLWKPRLDLLLQQLEKSPSILRLTYIADTESAGLVNDRLEAFKAEVTARWQALNKYRLVIETEIFWRRGGPAKRDNFD